MSKFAFNMSRVLGADEIPFDALIMAAMRRADTPNLAKLQHAFPAIWEELHTRYNAPGGKLPGERSAPDDVYPGGGAASEHPGGI